MVVDTHAHIYNECYENVENIINNAKNLKIKKIINCGESLKTSKEIISLYKKHSEILECAIGIHPEYANKVKKEELNEIEKLVKTEKVIAIGEIGLDYHYEEPNKEKQKELFKKQLDLAEKYKLPVIIHSRDAIEDTQKILKQYKLKGIIHCFSGSYETAIDYIRLGYKLGIGGVVTFKNSKLIEVLKRLDLKNIVFETDCPYLTPEPYRKYKNEPKYILETLKFISERLEITEEKLAYITNKNVCEIFDMNL